MPDHIHWLLQLKCGSISTVAKNFKGRTARKINSLSKANGTVWQKFFHDHALRRDEDIKTVARYIIANPPRAGLLRKIADYPWWWAVWVDDAS